MPTPVASDPVIDCAIAVFVTACRMRRYEQGVPLPLSTENITAIVEAHGVGLARELLDRCVFAIDEVELKKACKKMQRR